MYLRNVGNIARNHTVLQPRTESASNIKLLLSELVLLSVEREGQSCSFALLIAHYTVKTFSGVGNSSAILNLSS
jgi:hypothetical protein